MKILVSYISVAIALLSCAAPAEKTIISPVDYAIYLQHNANDELLKCNEELKFWNAKLSTVPESETYRSKLAGLFSSRFLLNGRVEDVKTSDSLYHLIQTGTTIESAALHRAMAANCITQHQFREAHQHIQKALEIGEGKAASLLMLVDVDLELGDYNSATRALNRLDTKNFFPYLIRKAKLKDHEGNLDSAILIMETALEKVKENPSLSLWAKSNLADMYGHAGRVKEAYAAYLGILQQNPNYDYALKGIAWIAYSHDHNTVEAKRIINSIHQKRATPDMHLMLAQIATTENNTVEAKKQRDAFTTLATDAKYGNMYNKYLALLAAEELATPANTIQLAKIEIRNRPTPASYDLLAWGYFKSGNIKEALTIAKENIEHKTYEPDALYHLGMIYKANGMKSEANYYFEQAEQSNFELGPVIAKKIKEALEG